MELEQFTRLSINLDGALRFIIDLDSVTVIAHPQRHILIRKYDLDQFRFGGPPDVDGRLRSSFPAQGEFPAQFPPMFRKMQSFIILVRGLRFEIGFTPEAENFFFAVSEQQQTVILDPVGRNPAESFQITVFPFHDFIRTHHHRGADMFGRQRE